jgi:hypothetical protein
VTFWVSLAVVGGASGVVTPSQAAASASSSDTNVVFASGFESGDLSDWSAANGAGTATVTSDAVHTGNYGLRLANSSGQYKVAIKALSAPLVDSSVSFWVRVNSAASGYSGTGREEIAQARNGASTAVLWGLVYDSSQQGFWFYPRQGSSAKTIFTGANSAPLGSWIGVEVRFTATSTGGAEILLDGQTQPSWGASGDFTRTDNLQRIQLWNDAATSTDYDDVAIATGAVAPPPAPANTAPPAISGTPQEGQVLTATTGTWSNGPTSYAYQWQDCSASGCSNIAGATSSSYTLQASDVGNTVDVVVTATNAGGSSSATSAQTSAVTAASSNGPPTGLPGLRVSGGVLVDGSGNVVRLHGVNRSGTEYGCIQGWGIFDGPSDDASVAAIASWHANIVRIPINEDCWLGINGVDPAYAGQNYIEAVTGYVNLLHQHGMYAELSLMWGAPGSYQATYQPNAPDEDHSPALWASLAQTFKSDPNVLLAPWGETTVGWSCFIQGCANEATYGPNNATYQTAGMQQAVDVMRQAGYHGPIVIPCIAYANICADPSDGGTGWGNGNWLQDHPSDPDNQLVAEMHIYGKNTCDTTSCLDLTVAPILNAGYPVIFGETGETYDDSDCGSSYISTFLNWADAHNVGYETWTWDTWGTCGSLISDYNGTPANAYGRYVKISYSRF